MSELRYSTNHEGQRVVPASQRADGSVRPERRIREGYVPQDEQPVYQSRGALLRRGVPQCPGADFVSETDKKATTQSKSAKKNEKRKQKKKHQITASVDNATEMVEGMTLNEEQTTSSQLSAEERQLRTLKKKIRQCESLEQRRAAGETLTESESAKLAKLPEWRQTVNQLESSL